MKPCLLLSLALVTEPMWAADPAPASRGTILVLTVRNGRGETALKVTVDTAQTPDLADWGKRAGNTCATWYPRIATLLASEGFTPPKAVALKFENGRKGVAATSRDGITIAADYVRGHTNDIGMVIHELTHVVQAYPEPKHGCAKPGWLVEGIADYIRLYRFEPDAPRPRINPDQASYRDSYKTAAAFMAWLEGLHPGIVNRLNRALREGRFKPELFQDCAGKPLDELWRAFAGSLKRRG